MPRVRPAGGMATLRPFTDQPEVVQMFQRSIVYSLCVAMLHLGSPMVANAATVP